MTQEPFHALQVGNNGLPLTSVSSTDSAYSPLAPDLTNAAFYYDPCIYQQYQHPQPFPLTTAMQNGWPMPQRNVSQTWPATSRPFTNTTTTTTTNSQTVHDLVHIAKRHSKSNSITSGVSETDDNTSEPHSPRDEAGERRKERRRAQNRAAQRAFRARKEETIKESSVRLEALQDELMRLQNTNGDLTETINRLRGQIMQLQHENEVLKRKSVSEVLDWADFDMNFRGEMGTASAAAAAPVTTAMTTTLQEPQNTGGESSLLSRA
jgi:bZIP transcription factor